MSKTKSTSLVSIHVEVILEQEETKKAHIATYVDSEAKNSRHKSADFDSIWRHQQTNFFTLYYTVPVNHEAYIFDLSSQKA